MRRLLLAVVALVIGVGVVAPATTGASAATSVRVSGTVIGGSGVSASDAQVWLLWGPSDAYVSVGDDGRFSASVPPGTYTVFVRSQTAGPSRWSFRVDEVSITADVKWKLTLPDRVNVRTIAKDSEGVPIADATVTAPSQYGDPVTLTPGLPAFSASYELSPVSTDADGQAVLRPLPDSDMSLRVIQLLGGEQGDWDVTSNILPLKTPTRVSVDASRDVTVVAKSLPLRTTTVRFKDHTGDPVAGRPYVTTQWGSARATLDSSGRGAFVLPEGDATLFMDGESSEWQLPSSWSLQQSLNIVADRRITFTLPETVKVTATVTDADTGDPAAGVFVNSTGTPDAARLSRGLEPAILENQMRGDTKADGAVRLRTFPDSDFEARAIERTPGAYRLGAVGQVDATSDTHMGLELPKSATVSLVVREADGSMSTGNRAGIRVGDDYVPFASADDGKLSMKLAADGASTRIELAVPRLSNGYCRDINRDIVVSRDTNLRYTLPEFHDVTVAMLDSRGRPLPAGKVDVTGGVTVLTDEGPIRVKACQQLTGDQTGVASLGLPQMDRADFRLLTEPEGAALNVPITDTRRLVIRAGVTTLGGGHGSR